MKQAKLRQHGKSSSSFQVNAFSVINTTVSQIGGGKKAPHNKKPRGRLHVYVQCIYLMSSFDRNNVSLLAVPELALS